MRSQRHLQEIHGIDANGGQAPRQIVAAANQTSSNGVADNYDVGALFDLGYPAATFSATGLPTGMTCAAVTGIISGTPTVNNTFNVVVTAASVYGNRTVSFTWTVS